MANPEHVEVVIEGEHAIAEWREQNRNTVLELSQADLAGANLCNADLSKANLSEANLSRADLAGANLAGANLTGANLEEAQLSIAVLNEADLSRANLSGAELIAASLSGANLSGADLIGTLFRGCYFTDTGFSGSRIGATAFLDSDLSTATGLQDMKYEFPGHIDVSTLHRSGGKIPISFLRECGMPENLFKDLADIASKASDFYTCFISFTEADDAFSQKLYNDLKEKGVRCYRYKEDMKMGESIWDQIDRAVYEYDKVIVVCSEYSLKAPAVLEEIGKALAKEDRLTREGRASGVLFPIRLDDFVLDGWKYARKDRVTNKLIGDFREWENGKIYKEMLDKLIEALRAEKQEEAD